MNRQRGFLLLLITVAGVLAVLMAAPFLGYILAGVLLGFILYPVQARLTRYVPGTVAAGIVIVLTILAAILPVLITAGFVADDAARLAQGIGEDTAALDALEQTLQRYLGADFDLRERITGLVRSAASVIAQNSSRIVQLATSVAIGLSLMLFVQFYVLRDGNRFVAWTKQFDLLPTDMQESLYHNTAETTRSLIKGHVLVAVLQGVIAGIGLLAVGIPNVFFWTFIMILLGFIPLVGTAFLWVPAALYLALMGNLVYAAALLVYGAVIVGATDNFARPLLVDDTADIHEVFILLGIIGGVLLFGAIGIFVGPLLYGILKDLLELYRENYDTL